MPPRGIVLATHNAGKVAELTEILKRAGVSVSVLSLRDFPGVPPVEETGESFEENAIIKARHVCLHTGLISIADDSGLEVDALGGLPGVRSARFAGPHATDEENNLKLLSLLQGVPLEKRKARFVAAVALCTPSGHIDVVRGTCEGLIITELRGSGGFGYDPLFLVPETGLTFAEMDVATKNRISHRGKALRAIRPRLLRVLSDT